VLATPLCRLFFEHGAFTAADTAGTAAMLQMYAIAVFGICFHRVSVPVYYALGNPNTPMRLSLGAMLAKVPVILLLTRVFGMGSAALPLSHAITVSGECALLAYGFASHLRGRGLVSAHLRMLVAAAVLGGVAYALADHLPVVVVCGVAGVAYLGTARLLGVWEWLGRPRGLPPFLDGETRAALETLAKGPVLAVGDTLVGATGTWRMVVRDGALGLVAVGAGAAEGAVQAGPAEGVPVAIGASRGDGLAIIVRVGRAPSMRGLQLGDRVWQARDGVVVEAPCEGPRIPVAG
jgi:hypothetical protein